MSKKLSLASLIASMAIFGTIGVFRQFIPLSSTLVAFVRGVIGTVFLTAVIIFTKKGFSFGAVKKNLAKLLASGALIGLNWAFLFEAYNHTTVAVATLCYYMAPVFVMLASPLVLHERLTFKSVLCIVAAIIGMVLVSGILEGGGFSSDQLIGVAFALGAAAMYAGVILINKKTDGISPYERTTVELLAAAIALTPYLILTEDFSALTIDVGSVLMLIVVGVIHTGLAYALYFAAIGSSLDAGTIALFSYIDPILAVILSAAFLGEDMTWMTAVGAVIVIGALICAEMGERRK